MNLDPGWVSVGFAALALLQVAALAQQRSAREDRKVVMEKLDDLRDKVGHQNGRVGKLEQWRDGHEKWADIQSNRFDETDKALGRRMDDQDKRQWDGPERRRNPRHGTTEK